MRAFGPPGTVFDPPQSVQFSFGASVSGSGYVLTTIDGKACLLDDEGVPTLCTKLQVAGGPTPASMQLRSVEGALGGGHYFFANQGEDTAFVLRTDENLALLWQRGTVFEGSMVDDAIWPLADGGVVLGHSRSQGFFQRPVLNRFDANGNVLWQRTYRNGSQQGGHVYFKGLAETSDGGFVAVGQGNSGTPHPVVVRLDNDGTVLWAKEVEPTANGGAEVIEALELAGGQIRVVVKIADLGLGLATITLTASGDVVSATGYQGFAGGPVDVRFLADGGFTGVLDPDGVGFRIAADGTPLFATVHGALPGSVVLSKQFLPTPDGGHLFHGHYSYTLFGDMTPILYKTGPLGQLPAPFGSAQTITPTVYSPTATSITLLDSLVSSTFVPPLDFLLTPALADTLFGVPNLVPEFLHQATVRAVPNPAIDRVTVEHPGKIAELRVRDAEGKLLRVFTDPGVPVVIHLDGLPSGLYELEVKTANGTEHARFIKQ